MRDRAWLLGFLVGPLFAWLCWAVSRRRWSTAGLALLVNLAFWIGGGWFITEMMAVIEAGAK